MTRVLLACVLPVMLVACTGADEDYLVGTLERDRIEIPAELSEPVTALHVHEGDRVRAGELLLELDAARARAELARLAAERERAQRRVDELVRGPRAENIREARAQLEAAAGRLAAAQREFERLQELAAQNLASAAELDAARATLDTARGERDAARAALDALLEGVTVEELDQARAQLAAAEAAMRAQQIVVERLSVEAPRDARVEALPYKPGSQPQLGAAVAVLLADGAPHARVFVPVARREHFTEGSEVHVNVIGAGEYDGIVRWVSSEAAFTPYYALTEHDRDRLSFAAEIELAGDDAATLAAGLPVEVYAGKSR